MKTVTQTDPKARPVLNAFEANYAKLKKEGVKERAEKKRFDSHSKARKIFGKRKKSSYKKSSEYLQPVNRTVLNK